MGVSLSGLAILVTVNFSCVFTEASQVFDIEVVNISATNMTLTWKINDDEASSVYTYVIQVAGAMDSFNLNTSETWVNIPSLKSSTLYNITVRPFLQNGSEGVSGFLQVYTREFTHCFAKLSCLPAICFPALKESRAQCGSPRGLLPPSGCAL